MPARSTNPSIAIIGAGPAGLFAAHIMADAGFAIHVYERKPSVGRKFLMAGRGGLNLTHSEDIAVFKTRYGHAQPFIAPLIDRFTPDDLRIWCEALGQETFIGTSGRVFPKSLKASPLLRAWIAGLEVRGVHFHLHHTWQGWDENGALIFTARDGTREAVTPDATLLALGGASWPGLGADGSWVPWLKACGISISALRPANGGFHVTWSDYFADHFAGHPLKNITLTLDNHTVSGEMMITRTGIEGGAVYALSAPLRDALDAGGIVNVHIDLRPHQRHDELVHKLSAPRGRQSFATFLKKTIKAMPLHTALLREADKDIATRGPAAIAALMKSLPLRPVAPCAIDRAISTAGGIALDALDDGLMLRTLPGVFAAGEMLDWEAPTGGYLLQGCFATGQAAAHGIINWLGRR